jgi:hypothetical protein
MHGFVRNAANLSRSKTPRLPYALEPLGKVILTGLSSENHEVRNRFESVGIKLFILALQPMTRDHVHSSEGVRDVRLTLARLFNHTKLSGTCSNWHTVYERGVERDSIPQKSLKLCRHSRV